MHLPYDQGEGQHTIAMRVPALHRSKPRAPGATRDPLATNARRPARRAQLEQSSISPMRADAGYYRRECALRPPRRKRGDACRPRAHGLCAHGLCAMNDIRENSRYGAARERSPSLRAQATRFGASHVAVVRQASGHVRALWTVRVRRADRDSNPHGGNAANATRAPFRRRHAFLLLGRASRARRGRTEPMPVRCSMELKRARCRRVGNEFALAVAKRRDAMGRDGARRDATRRDMARHGTTWHGTARIHDAHARQRTRLLRNARRCVADTGARRSARTRVRATTSAAPRRPAASPRRHLATSSRRHVVTSSRRHVVTSSRRHVTLVARPHHRRRHQHQHRPSRAPQSATSAPTTRHGLDAANARETGPDRGHQAQSAARRRTRAATPHVAPRIDRRTDRRAPLEIALAAPIFETLTQPHPRAACFDRYVTATRTDRHACPRVRRPRSRRTRP
ncbi:hypothetical protein X946_2364 [Burkholderia sp. ABCPW 111]|nr:hypothetical protein X946_2364 [Burkholderia sp. ABCPW 111]